MGSLHGQDIDYIQKLDQYPAVFLLTDHKHTWKHVATKLCEHGRGHYIMHVGSNLSYPDQQIITATASELSEAECSLPLCSVIIDRPAPSDSQPGACLQRPASIADEQFTRGDVPMTKQDIRVLALSKLCLEADDHLLDVGAGTGSVSVEAAQVLTRGRVTAIERKPQAIELIEANARKFGVGNITIRQGSAPGQLEGLAGVTKVFVGGSGGELPAIMQWVAQNTAPGTRVVITAVTLNTLQLARECLDSCFFDTPEFTNVAITRVERMGTSDMLRAQTPVWIINTKRK
jgi:precorrin-6Y C5,15-methyltransferase (decarboxylating)